MPATRDQGQTALPRWLEGAEAESRSPRPGVPHCTTPGLAGNRSYNGPTPYTWFSMSMIRSCRRPNGGLVRPIKVRHHLHSRGDQGKPSTTCGARHDTTTRSTINCSCIQICRTGPPVGFAPATTSPRPSVVVTPLPTELSLCRERHCERPYNVPPLALYLRRNSRCRSATPQSSCILSQRQPPAALLYVLLPTWTHNPLPTSYQLGL